MGRILKRIDCRTCGNGSELVPLSVDELKILNDAGIDKVMEGIKIGALFLDDYGYVCQIRSSRKNGLDKKPGLIRRILNWLKG
jgi:hypothetical protein